MQEYHCGLFGRIAVHLKFITPDQLNKAVEDSGRYGNTKRIGDILFELGWIDQEQVKQIVAFQRKYEETHKAKAAPAAPEVSPEAAIGRIALEKIAVSTNQPKKIEELLVTAAKYNASDLHVHVGHPLLLRWNGQLKTSTTPPYTAEETESLLLEILTPEQLEHFNQHSEIGFAHEVPGQLRVRAAYCRQQRGGVDGVFRIIPFEIPTIESLGLPREIARFTTFHQGMVLFTGPTGCGKSTTLAALLSAINAERKEHIISIEDPIEYIHPSKNCLVRQRQVIDHTTGFSRALRAALREDPDIIVVGEMRDRETISLAISAAETGHLVYGTLHTNNAVRTINRILDAFPPEQVSQIRSMVSSSLRGVISQRLLPTADGKSRVPVLEILVVTPAVSNLIREGKMFQIPGIMQMSKNLGMRELDDSLAEYVEQGIITRETASQNAGNPERFQ
ncbi:MAG: type IV pilus twitching motility protein PilT [Deltaproteobacteria bacterium]|nr:type IV pilus twitching motility protein PilT [Deltaproteobacteria bacterium]MBW1872068.1 type IV pilus twitching motility protein PilT [Deltaproteobacteria bacterium]